MEKGVYMEKLMIVMPEGGPWESLPLPVFGHPERSKRDYLFVARADIGRVMRPPEVLLKKFIKQFRQCSHSSREEWAHYTLKEKYLPYLLSDDDKPVYRTPGWAPPHIYSMLTVTGLACIFSSRVGSNKSLASLFPQCSAQYLERCAETLIRRHNELTGQSLTLEQLAAYLDALVEEEEEEPSGDEDEEEEEAPKKRTMNDHAEAVFSKKLCSLRSQIQEAREELSQLEEQREAYLKLTREAQQGLLAELPVEIEEDPDGGGYMIVMDAENAVYRERRRKL